MLEDEISFYRHRYKYVAHSTLYEGKNFLDEMRGYVALIDNAEHALAKLVEEHGSD